MPQLRFFGATKRFPSSRCASAIQSVRPSESTAETQPQLQPALLRRCYCVGFVPARKKISGQSKGAVYRDQRHRKAGHRVSGAWSAVRDSWLGHRLAAPRLPEVRRDSRCGDRSLSPRKTSRQTTIETSPHVRQEGHSLQAPRLAIAVL